MTFGSDHYVPVLKVKRGEKSALAQLAPELRKSITPLLEVVEMSEGNVAIAAHLNKTFKGLADSVRIYPRCFLDLREIAAAGPDAAVAAFRRATADQIRFTPVTGLSRTADPVAALAHQSHGLAIRLTRQEFEAGALAQRLERFLKTHGLQASGIDLVLDLGAVEDLIIEGVVALSRAFMAEVPHHSQWRTFTLSSSAFPRSMGVVERHAHQIVERSDWIAWKEWLFAGRHQLERLPTFSDCAIQHPEGVEGFDPRIMQVSAAIRYTLERDWLLVKGESTRSRSPSVQFPQIATRLVYGHLRTHFAGQQHCRGCAQMKAAADGEPGFGSAEAWRKLGTIHHLSSVAKAVGSLA